MAFLCIILGIVFFTISIFFFSGIGLDYIPQWRDTPAEVKNKINISRLSKNVGIIFLLVACIFLVSGMSSVFLEKYFLWSMIGWILITCLDIYWINKSKRDHD